jgi:hypothetical protein
LAAARSILFVLAAAVVLSVVVIGAAPVALAAGPSVSLVLTPNSATITTGQSQGYQATVYETNGQQADAISFDVTSRTTFTIAPDGSCTADTRPAPPPSPAPTPSPAPSPTRPAIPPAPPPWTSSRGRRPA